MMRKPRKLSSAQQAFAHLRVDGKTQGEAYRIAYGRPHASAGVAGARGSRIDAHPGIAAYIATLSSQAQALATQQVAAKLAIDKEYVMRSLHEVAERCMQHKAVLDKRGDPVYVETPSGEQAPAYVFDSKGAVNALVPLGKELGMFVDRKEIRSGPLADVADAELDAKLRQLTKDIADITGKTVAEVLRDNGLAAADDDGARTATPGGEGQNSRTGPIH